MFKFSCSQHIMKPSVIRLCCYDSYSGITALQWYKELLTNTYSNKFSFLNIFAIAKQNVFMNSIKQKEFSFSFEWAYIPIGIWKMWLLIIWETESVKLINKKKMKKNNLYTRLFWHRRYKVHTHQRYVMCWFYFNNNIAQKTTLERENPDSSATYLGGGNVQSIQCATNFKNQSKRWTSVGLFATFCSFGNVPFMTFGYLEVESRLF